MLASLWVQLSVSVDSGWPHNALRHHWLMPVSCHFRDCKAQLVTSLTHVSGAITSVQTFTFTAANVVRWCWTKSRSKLVYRDLMNILRPSASSCVLWVSLS